MKQGEKRRRKKAIQPVVGAGDGNHRGAGCDNQQQIEAAPGERSRSKKVNDAPVGEINPRHIHLDEIAVEHEPMIHEETKIADLRGIVDLRPVKGADDEYAKTGGEPNEKDGAEDRLNFGCMA